MLSLQVLLPLGKNIRLPAKRTEKQISCFVLLFRPEVRIKSEVYFLSPRPPPFKKSYEHQFEAPFSLQERLARATQNARITSHSPDHSNSLAPTQHDLAWAAIFADLDFQSKTNDACCFSCHTLTVVGLSFFFYLSPCLPD